MRDYPGSTLSGQPMAETQERLQVLLADRYQVQRELGKGGMATVFLARDIRHEREVAIKVLHPELAASIGADRFDREIKVSARLQHPHILGLIDSGVADGLLYYVMPFVKGESLRDRLEREGQLPVDDAIQITLEVADALGHAHQQGIVHRDIKPENIMMSGGHALVADFGIARAAEAAGGQRLTQTGMAVGTPVYMSPEQAVGETTGPTSDLYSLGCMLYEMLAGEPPFNAKSPQALLARHAMEAVPSIRIVRNTVPEEVEDAIFSAMAKVPADRPQTAAKFAEMLGLPLGSTAARRVMIRTTAGRRVPTTERMAYRVQLPWYRRPLVLAVAGLGLVVVAGATWLFGFRNSGGGTSAGVGLDARNIAILYFEDLSKDKQLGYLADGLTEALIGSLSTVPQLKVRSRDGVEPFRGTTAPIDSIGRALQVGTVVRGSVEPEGDRIRVNVSVEDGNSGANRSRQGVTLAAGNDLALTDSLTLVVSDLIREELRQEIRVRQQREGTRNVAAWSLVQRAEQSRRKADQHAAAGDTASMSREYRLADSLLAAAEELDSRWAEPIVLRGLVAYRHARNVGLDQVESVKWVKEGLTHAERAVTKAPQNAFALEYRGILKYWGWLMNMEADPDRALALITSAKSDLEQATLVNPAQAGAWNVLSHLYYNFPGTTTTDVNLAASRALEADAFLENADRVMSRLFLSSYDLDQVAPAERTCGQIRQRFPATLLAVQCPLYLLTTRQRTADAATVAEAWRLGDSVKKLASTDSERLESTMLVAAVIAKASQTQPALADSARRVVRRSEGNSEVDPTREAALPGAMVYLQLGDKQDALRLIKVYFAANPQRRASYRDDPGWWFRSLQDDPEFKQIVGAR